MAKFPAWLTAKRVDSTTLDQGIPNIVTKVAVTTISASTTLTNDAELTGISLAVGTWEIEVMLWVGGIATGNFKSAWAFTTGTLTGTPNRACIGPGSSNSAAPNVVTPATMLVNTYTTAVTYGLASATLPFYVIKEECPNFVVATVGTLSIQVAQSLAVGTTTVNPGSRVKCRQIA